MSKRVLMIEWNRASLERLKKAIADLVPEDAAPNSVLTFEGHTFLVSYAHYLVEYLEGRLEK